MPHTLQQHCNRLAVGSKQTIADWRYGRARPGAAFRARIAAQYGIPIEAWEQDADFDEEPVRPERDSDDEESVEVLTPLGQCMELLAAVQKSAARPNLIASERAKLTASASSLIALRQKLERDAELTEDRFVREHPAWQRVRRVLATTLAKYPAAAREVADALARLGM